MRHDISRPILIDTVGYRSIDYLQLAHDVSSVESCFFSSGFLRRRSGLQFGPDYVAGRIRVNAPQLVTCRNVQGLPRLRFGLG